MSRENCCPNCGEEFASSLGLYTHECEHALIKFKVRVRSIPGFYAQYEGTIEVYARDEEDAKENAFLKLKRTAFKERSRDMWKFDNVEIVRERKHG